MAYDRARAHMNADHVDALVAIAQVHGNTPGTTHAQIIALDDAGMVLEATVGDDPSVLLDITFVPPITPDTVRERMVALAQEAHEVLAGEAELP